jgi:hypothetical protein
VQILPNRENRLVLGFGQQPGHQHVLSPLLSLLGI